MCKNSKTKSDSQTVTVTLGRAEVPQYDEARVELGVNIKGFVRIALKLLLWVYQARKNGAVIKMVYPDDREVELEILELEGVRQS